MIESLHQRITDEDRAKARELLKPEPGKPLSSRRGEHSPHYWLGALSSHLDTLIRDHGLSEDDARQIFAVFDNQVTELDKIEQQREHRRRIRRIRAEVRRAYQAEADR